MNTADPNPPLRSARLRLQPLCQDHAQAMFALLDDPTLYTWMDQGPPDSAAALRELYRRLEARASPDGQETWLNWVLFEDPAVAPLGFVQASVLSDGRSWVAYVLGRDAWGHGYATETMAAVLQHLFSALHVNQAMAVVEQDNTRSIALLRRLGFTQASGAALDLHVLTATEQLWLLQHVTPSTC